LDYFTIDTRASKLDIGQSYVKERLYPLVGKPTLKINYLFSFVYLFIARVSRQVDATFLNGSW
jgi:hypothetical protein